MERVQDGDLERENAVLGEAGIPRLDAEHRRRERSNKLMVRRGYPKDFSGLICNELKTDFLCERMMYYIAGDEMHSLEDVADEMLSLKAFRDRLVEKHISEHAQARINELYNSINEGLDDEQNGDRKDD